MPSVIRSVEDGDMLLSDCLCVAVDPEVTVRPVDV